VLGEFFRFVPNNFGYQRSDREGTVHAGLLGTFLEGGHKLDLNGWTLMKITFNHSPEFLSNTNTN